MGSRTLLTLTCCAFCCTAQECIQISGDRVMALHLAKAVPEFSVLPPDLELAATPVPGATRRLSVETLTALARNKGIAVEPSKSTCIQRADVEPGGEDLLRAMMKSFYHAGFNEVSVRVVERPRLRLPPGELEFPLTGLSKPAVGGAHSRLMWRGRLIYSSSRSLPLWALVEVSVQLPVSIFSRDLPANSMIAEGDVREETRMLSWPANVSRISPADAVGAKVRRAVSAGAYVHHTLLSRPAPVQRGHQLTVSVKAAHTHLSFRAKAESSASVGDLVVVHNESSRRRFKATVTGPGAAEVRVE